MSQPNDPLRVSYSAVSDWRACPQRYQYSYVDKLRPKVESPAPTLGRILHRYLEYYYTTISSKGKHLQAHRGALEKMEAEFNEECGNLAWTAESFGDEKTAREMRGLVELAVTLARTYYRVRGKSDAEEHKILLIEEDISAPVIDGIVLPGIADLVTQDKDGRTLLWEHKTTRNVPAQGRRFRDLQTLIYIVLLEMTKGVTIDGIVWNYMRTYPPQKPELLKSTGDLTKRKDLVTTTELYRQAISENGLEIENYAEALATIKERELQVMFPRFELAVVQSEEILLRDFILSALEIQKAVSDSTYVPIRNVSTQCDWCPYLKLCQGALLGGDDEMLKGRLFVSRKKKESTDGRSNSEEDFSALLTE